MREADEVAELRRLVASLAARVTAQEREMVDLKRKVASASSRAQIAYNRTGGKEGK